MKFHILTENRAKKRGILAEHGLSIYIEHENMNILFDTGQSNVYCHNADRMGIDLGKIDCIVLSHGHYDHCGGLTYFPNTDNFPKIYSRKEAFEKKNAINPDKKTYREIGIPWSSAEYRNNIVFTDKNMQIAPRITLCSEIPYTVPFEEVSKDLYIDNGNTKTADLMIDEQMLVYDTDKGLVIFLGCSHPGIANCLSYALKLFPERKIDTLVAGMHLENVSSDRLQKTIQFLQDLDIQRIVPLHCTGIIQICEMKRALGEKCLIMCAGDTLEILK